MTEFIHVTTEEQFDRIIDLLETEEYIAMDTETNGLNPYRDDRLIGISYYFPSADVACYVPINHVDQVHTSWLQFIYDVYPGEDVTYVMFNSKFDLHFLHVDGFRTPECVEDVMIAAQLYNENEDNFKLKDLSRKYLGEWAVEGEHEISSKAKELGLNPKTEMWKLPSEAVWYYAAMDALITWKLREFYMPQLVRWKLDALYDRRNEVNLKGYFEMERRGIQVDRNVMDREWSKAEKDQNYLEELMQKEAKAELGLTEFNPRSPKQIKELFAMLRYPLEDTRALTLESLIERQDSIGWWADMILSYRQAKKECSTYYEPYSKMLDQSGRLHGNLFTVGTVTGRISSRLQQLPRKKGYSVKQIFVPTKGHVLVQADFKAIELRIATFFAKEPQMTRMFNEGIDPHQYTADMLSEMLGKPVSRHYGKTANFGLLYGLSAYRWDEDKPCRAEEYFGLPLKETKEIVDAWHSLYPNFRKAYKSAQVLAQTEREGHYYLRLWNDRMRHLDPENNPRSVKDSLNFLVQGTGAAITEESIRRLAYYPEIKLLLQVHDSIVFEVAIEDYERMIPIVVQEMEDWPQFDPKIEIEIEASVNSWADFQEIDKHNPSLSQLYPK